MPIQIACPTCQRQLRVPDNLIGQMVKCPSCQNTFTATAEESQPPRDENIREERPSPLEERADDDEPRRRPRRDDDDFDDRPPRRRRRREDMEPHRGTMILVLGILALTGLGILTGIPAWIMGNADMAKIRAGTMDPEGESNTNIGRILGMVSTIIFLLTVVPMFFCCCLGGMGGAMKN
jgi:predicted Zn finger-like uncharacterized protein